ncbi:MAG: AmmeMemoRadiSam system protein B [Armatimonadetes bacterium]|nr:AmmeMemoRadiSam system protein B [Armatimonadota bacterium]
MSEPRPKLRPIEVRHVVENGRALLLLRDPLALSDRVLLVPQSLAPALALCDGTRDAGTLGAALALRYGIRVPTSRLREMIATLDEALFLEGDRCEQARRAALAAYRAAPFRPPALAGAAYPSDPEALRAALQGYLETAAADVQPAPEGRGVLSPHIDYPRGGPVYARVWKRAAAMARAADLAVILGTDHQGGEDLATLTRQSYATPYGVLPTPREAVDALAAAVGEEAAFAGELRHRSEHAIELAAIWLHHVRGGEACALLPILCGSFVRFVRGEADAGEDATLTRLLAALASVIAGRRALVIAAGDLSHVGPAFGGPPLDLNGRARLRAADDALLRHVCAGDAPAFLSSLRSVSDRNNVCGLPPLYLALRLLGSSAGEVVAYDCCPADASGASVVSIAGVVFS